MKTEIMIYILIILYFLGVQYFQTDFVYVNYVDRGCANETHCCAN
jgi:hypothetical protein